MGGRRPPEDYLRLGLHVRALEPGPHAPDETPAFPDVAKLENTRRVFRFPQQEHSSPSFGALMGWSFEYRAPQFEQRYS